jgi:hypothetical protein
MLPFKVVTGVRLPVRVERAGVAGRSAVFAENPKVSHRLKERS